MPGVGRQQDAVAATKPHRSTCTWGTRDLDELFVGKKGRLNVVLIIWLFFFQASWSNFLLEGVLGLVKFERCNTQDLNTISQNAVVYADGTAKLAAGGGRG